MTGLSVIHGQWPLSEVCVHCRVFSEEQHGPEVESMWIRRQSAWVLFPRNGDEDMTQRQADR